MSIDGPDWGIPTIGPNSLPSSYERRSTIYNDPEIEDGETPPDSIPATSYYGKFFTRGCRGVIEEIAVYCMRTGSGTMTVRLSPHPGLGPVQEVTITPGASWAWQSTDIEEMWNYDSLWIWISRCDADVSWAFDDEQPYDCHSSPDNGATWTDMNMRMFIRAVYTGETPGDVPISGIVNNIPIPNYVPDVTSWWHELTPAAGGSDYYRVEGVGVIKMGLWWPGSLDAYNNLAPWIRVDDKLIQYDLSSFSSMEGHFAQGDVKEGITWPRWDGTNDEYRLQWMLDIPFRRYADIGVDNTGAAQYSCYVHILPYLLR